MSFVVSSLSQKPENSSNDPWFLTEKVLRNLKCSFDLGLVFQHSECLKLVGFCDSEWGGDPDDRSSTSGYCFEIWDDCSFICWSCRKRQTVAFSSTEAEYMNFP